MNNLKRVKRITRYFTLLLSLMLIIQSTPMKVLAGDLPVPKIIIPTNLEPYVVTAGSTAEFLIPVKCVNYQLDDASVSIDLKDTCFSSASKYVIYYSATSNPKDESAMKETTTLAMNVKQYVKFSLKVKDTAKAGDYTLNMKFNGLIVGDSVEPITVTPSITVRVENEKSPASLQVTDTSTNAKLESGAAFDLALTVMNSGDLSASQVKVSVDGYSEEGIQPNYKTSSFSAGTITGGKGVNVTLPLMVSKNAKPGKKSLTITMKYKDSTGAAQSDTSTVYLDVTKSNTNTPNVVIDNTSYPDSLKAGNEFNFVVSLKNKGLAKAKSVKIAVTNGYSIDGLIPNYTTENITAPSLLSGDKASVKIPMIVSDTATAGVKNLSITITYTDSSGNEYTEKSNIYLEVVTAEGVSIEGKPNLVISNVSQSPQTPNAGGTVSVTFTIENKSKVDIKEMKIATTNLTNANFSPSNSKPYTYVESLKAGTKKQITMQFSVSKTIAAGLNDLDVSLVYKDKKGKEYSDTAKIYIIDVVNELGASQSKPKLIISDFTTGKKDLVAGKVFDFKFSINNTHSNLSANNIKVTITSADNVFSITNGSNTFYIPSIGAGETIEKEVKLKIKSDSVTKAYPIEIKFEYEYEGINKVKTSEGVSDSVIATETLNIQVNENARPVVNNIVVGAYEPPTVNMPTTLTFEFYNMGRSTLNNVMARIEGDFSASSNMVYIGNVEAGNSDMQELEVTPAIEGQGSGTLIISYEDSNGDAIEKEFPFEALVQGAMPIDNAGMGEMPIVNIPVAKKPIVKTWLFVLIQAGIVIGGVPLSRKVVIGLYKKKLRKAEEEV